MKRDLELAIIGDLDKIDGAVERMLVRMYQYRGYAKSKIALSDAEDVVYDIKKDLRKLRETLERA